MGLSYICQGDNAVEKGGISQRNHTDSNAESKTYSKNLNKTGFPTRSEVTDAAHASMAECVMINKGPHIVESVKTLIDILNKSGRHHWKKRNMMRPLNIAENFILNLDIR